MTETHIRLLQTKDAEPAAHVFHDATMNGTAEHYSLAQRQAWAGPAPDEKGWQNRFDGLGGFAAEIGDRLVGFMSLDDRGYIDLAFVHSEFAGRGIGRMLYEAVEDLARQNGCTRLTTEASERAMPVFVRFGWQIAERQHVEKRGVMLTNYRMFKVLG